MTSTVTDNDYPRDTEEFVSGTVICSVSLTSQTVLISINRGADYDWQPAQWVGSPGTTRTARLVVPVVFSEADYPEPLYQVYVRVIDSPEIPIMHAGQITVG